MLIDTHGKEIKGVFSFDHKNMTISISNIFGHSEVCLFVGERNFGPLNGIPEAIALADFIAMQNLVIERGGNRNE